MPLTKFAHDLARAVSFVICFLVMQLSFAIVCSPVMLHVFSPQTVFDMNSYPGICAMNAFALYWLFVHFYVVFY